MDKRALRRQALDKRSRMDPALAARLANQACQYLFSSIAWRKSPVIAVYASLGSEFPTHEIMEKALAEGKILLIPRVTDAEKRQMIFARCRELSDLRPGYRGIREPRSGIPYEVGRDALMLMPGLVFDADGWRLGYGGGFYDAYLAGLSQLPLCVGLCFAMQLAEHIPHADHDAPVAGICSEAGLKWICD